jgi:hypothetical protein
MLFLAFAILFTVTIRHRAIASPRTAERPFAARAVALMSIGLWTAVGTLGRGIGFW